VPLAIRARRGDKSVRRVWRRPGVHADMLQFRGHPKESLCQIAPRDALVDADIAR
jgi:hypothetical protein